MPARVYQPLHWWTETDVHLRRWRIWLTSDDLHPFMACGPSGNPYEGLIVYENREIFIFAGLRKADLLDTALHELIHANLWKRTIVGKRTEENAIRMVVPAIVATLKRHGWKPPELPDGWRRLANHARIVRYGSLQRDPDNE